MQISLLWLLILLVILVVGQASNSKLEATPAEI